MNWPFAITTKNGAFPFTTSALFEFLVLEGAQAGLSWETILNKRQNYRDAFDAFDPKKVASYDGRRIQRLLGNPGIVRNRLKLASSVRNAQAFLRVQKEFGTFDRYIWQFVGGRQQVNAWKERQVPVRTTESDAMSKDLKKRGFSFVGSTISLRLHAGRRDGERSRTGLFSVQ